MVKIGLRLTASLENIEYFKTCGEDFRWFIKVKCEQCSEESQSWQYACLLESTETKGGRGSSSMVEKCKLCSRDNHLDIIKESICSYTSNDDGKNKVVIAFDCRGMIPVKFDIRMNWEAKSSLSNKVFEEVDLSENEWYEYDDIENESVSITEVSYDFVKLKK